MFFKMFQSYKMKVMLGLSYTANLRVLVFSRNVEHSISDLGVQFLTVDEISLTIAKDPGLRNNFCTVFDEVIENFCQDHHERNGYYIFIRISYDLKYMGKPDTLKVLFESDFIQKLTTSIAKLYYKDT